MPNYPSSVDSECIDKLMVFFNGQVIDFKGAGVLVTGAGVMHL